MANSAFRIPHSALDLRCPTCRAPWRGVTTCARCGTDLAALMRVACPESICLVDGFKVPDLGYEQLAVIDGDCRSAAISAASILAKVTRDRYMRRAAQRHPGWDFETNVGYSTPEHRAAIAANGVSPLHRLSFDSIAYQQLALG